MTRVLITGATKRLGLIFTQACLKRGFQVIAHYRTDKRPLIQWLKKNPQFMPLVIFIKGDLIKEWNELAVEFSSKKLTFNGLINCASIFTAGNISDEIHLNTMVETNMSIPLQLGNLMAKFDKKGWIINLTDATITSYNKKFQNYRISKLFLKEITRQMANAYAPKLRVNVIAPGAFFPTKENNNKSFFEKIRKNSPLQKDISQDKLVQAMNYLIDNENSTGQTLYIDNGNNLR